MIREKKTANSKTKIKFSAIGIYGVLILAALLILGPFYIVLVTSFMDKAQAMSPTFALWPENFNLHGYVEVFTYTSGGGDTIPTVVRGFINTMIVVVPTTVVGTLLSALSAYAFAKIKFKGSNFMFAVLLATMMIPGTISLIPSYMIFDKIGWVDTFLPLVVPGLLGSANTVFFLRQFYFAIPDDLIDASRVDGLSNWGAFLNVILPLSVPALVSQLVLNFVSGYNQYLGPLLYLFSPEKYTLQIALNFFKGTYATDYAVVMAGAIVSLIPTTLMYLFGQKYFLEGIATSGMKL